MTRSLLLAGGGMKVAFQAGALQVLLSEADLHFDHYDACSGGAFNLAMLCDGRTGIEIADEWRETRPSDGVSARWRDLVRVPFAQRSLITLDAYRKKIFKQWGLDFDTINASTIDATFTVYNRTTGSREVFLPEQMDEDRLVACLSQAVWFPPVQIGDSLYTDVVFDTDANVNVALERHVDEIWVIWTVSKRPEWMPGLMAQFFHALEIAANGTLSTDLERARAQGVAVREIWAEVPVHYLVLTGADRLHRAVEMGVRSTRRWCEEHGYPLHRRYDRASVYDSGVSLTYPDHMSGRLRGKSVDANFLLTVEDAGRFVSMGEQRARLSGTVTCSLFDGTATVDGWARILVNAVEQVGPDLVENPARKRMEYVAHLTTPSGRALTLLGLKEVETPDLRSTMREAMTMKCHLMEGHVDSVGDEEPIAHGYLWMTWLDVLRQQVMAGRSGSNLQARLGGALRFSGMFVGNLWDVCARRVLTYAPF